IICDHLKKGRSAIINVQRISIEQSQRLIDFLNGVVTALDGDIRKLDDKSFLLTPPNIKSAGDIELA
ncbi:MAG: cell division protein SepF, partial [Erysipelotrichaceae bacterium]